MSIASIEFGEAPYMDLVHQAQGLDRDDVMQDVVGPVMTEFLQPIYTTPLTQEEKDRIPDTDRIGELPQFARSIIHILEDRLRVQKNDDIRNSERLRRLSDHLKSGLFHYSDLHEVLQEGTASGVVVPLTVATNIYSIENNCIRTSKDLDDEPDEENPLQTEPFSREGFVEIMRRKSFITMLKRLTRGPNGFLGSGANEITSVVDPEFLVLADPVEDWRSLEYRDAYDLRDGEVINFSQTFYDAANRRRKAVDRAHHPSSGCPVRHKFEISGSLQEPLVETAASFLIKAIQTSSPEEAK